MPVKHFIILFITTSAFPDYQLFCHQMMQVNQFPHDLERISSMPPKRIPALKRYKYFHTFATMWRVYFFLLILSNLPVGKCVAQNSAYNGTVSDRLPLLNKTGVGVLELGMKVEDVYKIGRESCRERVCKYV